MIRLTSKQVRRIVLESHGLLQPKPFGLGTQAVQRAIKQLHYIQIDTISVVDRAHHHVLKTRIPDYRPELLHALQSNDRTVFEYWSHAAAYMDMSDYRYYLPVMQGYRSKRYAEVKHYKNILDRIRTNGPLQSRDFDTAKARNGNGWWDWKPAKIGLERLFLSGELMISERKGFQKVYDLTERVLPASTDTRDPSHDERGRFYVLGMLTNLGIANVADIAYSRAAVKRFSDFDILPCIIKSLEEMLETGEVCLVEYKKKSYYCLSSRLKTPIKSERGRVSILSPFDNLIINRRRLRELFNYEYLLECYFPSAKREFGYFSLPLLYGDTLIGRLDCKADRKISCLKVHNIWLESNTVFSDTLCEALAHSLRRFQKALNCTVLSVEHAEKPEILRRLRKCL